MPTALILGGANCLIEDKLAALELFEPDMIIGCNHAARDELGRVDHWATMHPELFPLWIRQRTAAGRPLEAQLWHARHARLPAGIESTPIDSWGGSSGMLCVRLAIHLRCEKIVLAGVPMRKTFSHYDCKLPWFEARQYWSAWERRKAEMADRVRSLSGWTADLLGRPTREWLDGNRA